MSSRSRACSAAFKRLTTPCRCLLGRLATVLLFSLLVQGCAATPRSPFLGPDPSNPSARTPPVGYRSTVAPYSSRRPVDPVPWREQNERVAPRPEP